MAQLYRVKLHVFVSTDESGPAIQEEDHWFPTLTFAQMANITDQFYELLDKLKKIK
jgi:hypothetical protein